MLVDSHCHLQLIDYQALGLTEEEVVNEASESGVTTMLCVATHPEQSAALKALKTRYPNVRVSLGLHPNEEIDVEPTLSQWLAWAKDLEFEAMGETGLDYYRSEGDLEWQRERFRVQIQAAKHLKKPLIIHTRQAKEDTLRIMREENASEIGGVMHCFTEDWPMAKAAIEMGFMISFSGIVTFKNAGELQEVARNVPLDQMLIETDCPYLAPVPHRGKMNRPGFVKHVAEFLGELKGCGYEKLAEVTTANYHRLFGA